MPMTLRRRDVPTLSLFLVLSVLPCSRAALQELISLDPAGPLAAQAKARPAEVAR
jgi:hypothetical protein